MQVVVQFTLVLQLRVIRVRWLYFDGHPNIGLGVDALEYLTKCSFIYFAGWLMAYPDFKRMASHEFSEKQIIISLSIPLR